MIQYGHNRLLDVRINEAYYESRKYNKARDGE